MILSWKTDGHEVCMLSSVSWIEVLKYQQETQPSTNQGKILAAKSQISPKKGRANLMENTPNSSSSSLLFPAMALKDPQFLEFCPEKLLNDAPCKWTPSSLNKILSYEYCSDYSWNKRSFRQRSWCHCGWVLWLAAYLQNVMERWIWNAAVRSDNIQHTHLMSTQSWDKALLLPSPATEVWGSSFPQKRPGLLCGKFTTSPS